MNSKDETTGTWNNTKIKQGEYHVSFSLFFSSFLLDQVQLFLKSPTITLTFFIKSIKKGERKKKGVGDLCTKLSFHAPSFSM